MSTQHKPDNPSRFGSLVRVDSTQTAKTSLNSTYLSFDRHLNNSINPSFPQALSSYYIYSLKTAKNTHH